MSYERLTADNAALLLVDHQTGLANGVTDSERAGVQDGHDRTREDG